ncbi:MAG: DUF4249 domain-containing protein [Lentimicrobiaceae bacterium]|jgi:hypothetical protein
MKYIKALFIISLFSILAVSCTEKIDIQLDDSYVRLVVDGAITTDTTAQTVILRTTSSYFYDQPAPRVTGANVSITDGTQTFILNEDTAGVYRTDPSVFGISGRTYTLNIKLANAIGGHADYSAVSILNPINPLDSVGLLLHPEWSKNGIWEVKCYVQEPPSVDFYRFLIFRNRQLLTDSLNEWFATDDKFFNGNYTNGATVAYLQQGKPDEGLIQGDTVTVEVNSISKEYYTFIMEAQAELRGSNPLFSGPPSNVTGNINNGAIGFFAAYSATRSSAIVPEFSEFGK